MDNILLKSLCIIAGSLFFVQPGMAQEKHFTVQLNDIQYDSLYIYGLDYHGNRIMISGQYSGTVWDFSIPDSVYDALPEFSIVPKSFDYNTYTSHYTLFKYIDSQGDTLAAGGFNFEKDLFILAVYQDQSVYENRRFSIKVNSVDTLVTGRMIMDNFIISADSGSAVVLRIKHPAYSYFWEAKTYEESLRDYIKLASDYPDLRYTVINLARNVTKYKTKNDLSLVFDKLSEQNRQSSWGQIVSAYLSGLFDNISLPDWKSNRDEPVVRDTEKHALIVFTASWCKPCNEEIPLLKEIYRDLKENMDMIFISIDEEETVEHWQKLMVREEIPWRSLLAYRDIKDIKKRYHLNGIPQCILVHPGGNMENLDVRDDMDRKKLYEITTQ